VTLGEGRAPRGFLFCLLLLYFLLGHFGLCGRFGCHWCRGWSGL
jgi:hypothetical protein